MGKVLNFDAVVAETIDITKGGQTWRLRDDAPMAILVRTFALIEKQSELAGRKYATAEDAARWFTELQALTLELCGDIWRHTLPETTDAELDARFSFEEQLQLVMLFFTTRSSQLQRQRSALGTSSPTETTTATSDLTTSHRSQASSATESRPRASSTASSTAPRRQQRPGAAGATTPPRR